MSATQVGWAKDPLRGPWAARAASLECNTDPRVAWSSRTSGKKGLIRVNPMARLLALLPILWLAGSGCQDTTGTGGGSRERPVVYMQNDNGWRLYQVEIGGVDLAPLPTPTAATYPAVSPDGQFVAYLHETNDGGLEIMSLRDRSVTKPYLDVAVDQIAWSPTQDRLLLSLPFWGAGPGAGGLRVVNLSDTTRLDIAPDLKEAVWSPDGTTIIAINGDYGTRQPGIYALNPDGSEIHLIIPGAVRFPSWSPNGSRIAYSRGPYGSDFIYTARPDGNDERQLTYPDSTPGAGTDLKPVWSPDGSWIAFQREHAVCQPQGPLGSGGCGPRYDVFAVRADARGLLTLLPPQNLTRKSVPGGGFPSW